MISVNLWYRKFLYVGEDCIEPTEIPSVMYSKVIDWFREYDYSWIRGHDAIKVAVNETQLEALYKIIKP